MQDLTFILISFLLVSFDLLFWPSESFLVLTLLFSLFKISPSIVCISVERTSVPKFGPMSGKCYQAGIDLLTNLSHVLDPIKKSRVSP